MKDEMDEMGEMDEREQDSYRDEQEQTGFSPADRTFKDIFFTFNGRLSASMYVVASVIIILAMSASYYGLSSFVLGLPTLLRVAVMIIGVGLLLWSSLALTVKRLHDLGHSGWWVLLAIIPIVDIFMLFYLSLRSGKAEVNEHGIPGIPAHQHFAVVSYPIYVLATVLNFFPDAAVNSIVEKVPVVQYLIPFHDIKSADTVGEMVDAMPSVFDKEDLMKSLVMLRANGQTVAVGAFIAEDRIMVKGTKFAQALNVLLNNNQEVEVKGATKSAYLTKFIAGNEALTQQLFVFGITPAIGIPAKLEAEELRTLTDMGAFR